jgi:hypothetical protein
MKFSKDQFIGSFLKSSNDLVQLFNTHSVDLEDCDQFLEAIKIYLTVWKNIFKNEKRYESIEALKLLRGDHWEVWLTIALVTSSMKIELNEKFWNTLEKFISVNVVLLSNRCLRDEEQSKEILDKSYCEIRKIIMTKNYDLNLDKDEISCFTSQVKGEIFKVINNFGLTYLLVRLNIDQKVVISNDYNLKIINFHSIIPFDTLKEENSSRSSIKSSLEDSRYYLSNFMLVNSSFLSEFKNKEWREQIKLDNLVRQFPLSIKCLMNIKWTWDTFKETQNSYVQTIGKIYKIEELINYQTSNSVNLNTKRKVEYFSLPIPTSMIKKPKQEKPVNKHDISKAAIDLEEYFRRNEVQDSLGIIKASKCIDPMGTGLLKGQIVIEFLLELRRRKIFAKKRISTFEKWVEANSDENKDKCYYPNIFLNN